MTTSSAATGLSHDAEPTSRRSTDEVYLEMLDKQLRDTRQRASFAMYALGLLSELAS